MQAQIGVATFALAHNTRASAHYNHHHNARADSLRLDVHCHDVGICDNM